MRGDWVGRGVGVRQVMGGTARWLAWAGLAWDVVLWGECLGAGLLIRGMQLLGIKVPSECIAV